MTEEETKNEVELAESPVEAKPSEGHSGGRQEAIHPETVASVDETSGYEAAILGDLPLEAREEDSLPPVPEGVLAVEREAPAFDEGPVQGVEVDGEGDSHHFEGAPPVVRFLGSGSESEFDGFPEDYVSPEQGTATFGEVLVQLLDAALEGLSDSSEPLTGEGLVKIFCRGDVQDERVVLLLSLLAQDQPVTGELVVAVLRAQGHEELVDGALLTREELARAGEVAVEQLEASSGHFVPLDAAAAGVGNREYGVRSGSGSGSDPTPLLPTPYSASIASSGSGSEMASSVRKEPLQVAAQSPKPLAPALAAESRTPTRETSSTVVEAL